MNRPQYLLNIVFLVINIKIFIKHFYLLNQQFLIFIQNLYLVTEEIENLIELFSLVIKKLKVLLNIAYLRSYH